MKLTNTFVSGKMNKDVDERLLPKGQYPHAENIRVANTDSSDVGAIESVMGNKQLTDLGLTNAKALGGYADNSNQKLYWFVTSDEKDLVLEYSVLKSELSVLLESSKPDGVLNFNKNYLITGVVKVINGDSGRDLLAWTDDYNNPRIINIERVKEFSADGFIEDDISLIKKPPRYAPKAELTYTSTTLENNIKNKFLSFAYRYRYKDGEASALSSFTNYTFAPSQFELDYQTMENEGMVNAFNAVRLKFDSGDERVTDVELVFKESNSNTVYLIERFNKENEGWGDSEEKSFLFSNSKILKALPEDELFRTYDNVPRKAKALEIIGNRLVFGNYVEQYNLENLFGDDINVDYSLSLINRSLLGEILVSTFSTANVLSDVFTFDIGLNELKEGSRITLSLDLKESTYDDGSYSNTLDFILNRDYIDCNDLASDTDFILFVEQIVTNDFLTRYTAEPPMDSEMTNNTTFTIVGSTVNSISIKALNLRYVIDDTPEDPNDNPDNTHEETSFWAFNNTTGAYFREVAVDTSLKTNRSYEVGIIYLDEYNRATTVLTDENNSLYVPQDFSTYQNKLITTINHKAPYWADRYKLVVKQNKGEYQTIYTNVFYEDGLFRWVKLEGANVDKVKVGDTLIVKSDLGGALGDVRKVRVLEIERKDADFIEGNENTDGDPIIEESGLYMKIKPAGIDMDFGRGTARTFEGGAHARYPWRVYTNPKFGSYVGGTFVPLSLNAGSRVRIYINFRARGKIEYTATYDKRFVVNGDYASVKDWFEAEVENLGQFGKSYTWNGVTDIGSNIDEGFGEADEWNQGSGWGFNDDGSSFFVVPHRKGTASRNITSYVKFEVVFSEGTIIFETEPRDINSDRYYETEQTFDIIDGNHTGNVQDQTNSVGSAIVEMDFFNCYVQGNGAESYRYKDAFYVGEDEVGKKITANWLNIDLRPTATSTEKYKEVRRFADLTYSAPYNENTNINGLNEFNLSRANYKEDIDKKYGFIQKLFSRDTNLVVLQEDKVSYVLFGKDVLMNADGTSNVTSIEDVLGQQVAYAGEYGISNNPESFTSDSNNLYFSDTKRGCVLRLGQNGLTEISMAGLKTWFKNTFRGTLSNKKVAAFDPFNDQYVIHPSSEVLTRPIDINCGEEYSENGVQGIFTFNIEYGFSIGDAGITFTSNGKPIKYTLKWDNNTYTTGFLGDSSYDQELIDLGLTATTGLGDGELTFNKDKSVPSKAVLEVYAPLCDTNFNISFDCVESDEIIVTSIILGGSEDENKSIKNRYKWSNTSYSSPYKNYNTIFGEDDVSLFEVYAGMEGQVGIPLTGSTVELGSYKSISDTAELTLCNRLGYLISSTQYTESQLQDILDNATYPTINQEEFTSGDVDSEVSFTFSRPSGEQYLYLIWDYRDRAPKAVNDYRSVQNGQTKNWDIIVNDTDPFGLPLTVVIDNEPVNGTVTVEPDNSVTYTHNGTETVTDAFTYRVFNGTCYSNVATVFIDIAVSCEESFSYAGAQGSFSFPISFGTATGMCGIAYDAFNVPDGFEIYWDGNLVATTDGLVSGADSLLFNKTSTNPTQALVVVTAPVTGTAWTISGICPVSEAATFDSEDDSFDSEDLTFDTQ